MWGGNREGSGSVITPSGRPESLTRKTGALHIDVGVCGRYGSGSGNISPVSQRELPAFKYHPDPIGTGSIVASDRQCEVCSERAGLVYSGAVLRGRRGRDDLPVVYRRWCGGRALRRRFYRSLRDLMGPRAGRDQAGGNDQDSWILWLAARDVARALRRCSGVSWACR